MKIKLISTLVAAVALSGCAGMNTTHLRTWDDPVVTIPELKKEPKLAPPSQGAITVAVYNFRDLTGQRKSVQNVASLSSAVTQGADNYLIQSLQTIGGGQWFKVVERGGLDNVIKERQLIRQMRELYQGDKAQPLPPMVFAGILLEGGIVGYDSNTVSGGNGARLLGIGASTEYRQDEVVISLRAVSVASGEVLSSVMVKKTVASVQDRLGVIKFYEMGTKAFELETGAASNESINRAVQLAVHGAVIELINDGVKKGHWAYAAADKITTTNPAEKPVEAKAEKKTEVKADDKK
jgi:curli production assembly/transport component CsgG